MTKDPLTQQDYTISPSVPLMLVLQVFGSCQSGGLVLIGESGGNLVVWSESGEIDAACVINFLNANLNYTISSHYNASNCYSSFLSPFTLLS